MSTAEEMSAALLPIITEMITAPMMRLDKDSFIEGVPFR